MDENDLERNSKLARPHGLWVRNLVLGIVILVCGAAIGSVITAIVIKEPSNHGFHRSDRLPQQIAERMQRDYGLTDAQKQQILLIFEEHAKKLSAIRAEVQPRVEAEHEALRKSVEAALGTELAEKWRAEYEHMRSLWHPRAETPQGSNSS